MTWYEFVLPSVAIALLVRLEATLIGPYWAWVELLSYLSEDDQTQRTRLQSVLRRVAIPGIVGFVLVLVGPSIYGGMDVALVGIAGACLLLWPMVFYGSPVFSSRWAFFALYGSFVAAFGASAWAGAVVYFSVTAEHGSVVEFVRREFLSLLVSAVVLSFATAAWNKMSSQTSREQFDEPRC